MSEKKKTATKKTTTKKKAAVKKKPAAKKASTKKKTSSKKATTKKTPKKTVAKKKSAAKKAPAKKKTVTKKKATAKKKTTTKKKSTRAKKKSPTIHTSEYVSPMNSIPLDVVDFEMTNQSIDLNDLPSLMDEIDIPTPPENKGHMVSFPSRLSFYMGVFFGAIVLHALMISVLAVMSV